MMIVKKITFLILLGLYSIVSQADNYGGECTKKSSCYDSYYPDIKEWAKAGVSGGIPQITNIKKTLNEESSVTIQSAIDNGGRGVVFLENGTYTIKNTIQLKDGVVLRGESKSGVTISVKMKRGEAIKFAGEVENAGIENLRLVYEDLSWEPREYRSGMQDGWYCKDCFQNDAPQNDHTLIRIDGKNNWIDNVEAIKSGSDPVEIYGNHNTVRGLLVEKCYNKGGGGEGYFDLRGDYNLITGSTIRLIRHFAIQQGAKYNVVIDNLIEVDINFHNKDDGYNLIEGNTIYRPSWHSWGVFATGGASYGHSKPGPKNIIFNNTTYDYREKRSEFAKKDVVYTYNGYGDPDETNWPKPQCGTFYAVDCNSNSNDRETTAILSTNVERIQLFPNLILDGNTTLSGLAFSDKYLININSLQGKKLYTERVKDSESHSINLSSLAKGVYLVQVIGSSQKKTFKILIK